jgi:hypothetical protein
MEANMIRLFNLIIELHHTDEYDHSLIALAEQELDKLSRIVRPNTRTGQAFIRKANLSEIIKAAEEDAKKYGTGIYMAVADLAIAIQNACWRWSDYGKSELELSLSYAA